MTADILPRPELVTVKQVKQATFAEIGQHYNRFSVTLPVGWTLDDALVPEAWAQIAGVLDRDKASNRPAQTGSIIEVHTQDHAFYAELYIRAVRAMALDVEVIAHKPLGPQDAKESVGFKTRWNVGAQGFDIIREADSVVVGPAKDFPKKEDALAWIEKMKA